MTRVALTVVPHAQTVDALVMASASCRVGEIVYTSDPTDLELLRTNVPAFSKIRIERA